MLKNIVVLLSVLTGYCFVCSHVAHMLLTDRRSPTENLHLNLFEGDIIVRDDLPESRSAIRERSARWPEGKVYYELDTSYTEDEVALIKSAAEEFHKLTCVEWIERTDEDDYVEISNHMGCASELGAHGGSQDLVLEAPLCMKKGVVLHEMMHTLGFFHEMSRPDRDEHISIRWGNIISGMEPNFIKMGSWQLDDLGLPYDYRSLMHYKAWAFAKDESQPTCVPKDEAVGLEELGYGQTAGEFTENDLAKINIFYECPQS